MTHTGDHKMSHPGALGSALFGRLVVGVLAALFVFGFVASACATTGAHYGLYISTKHTKNVTFANGVFYATADHAELNVKELVKELGAGNVEVTTGNGAGGDEYGDLHVDAGFTWAGKHALTLDAYHSVYVNAAVVDAGKGALTLTDNDGGTGGTFVYTSVGNITIWNLQNSLTIDGVSYLLDGSIQSLAGDIEAVPSGNYALANSYDASKDGTYGASPITTTFAGAFEGLGNTISNLTIVAATTGGLFLNVSGSILDLHLTNASVTEQGGGSDVGALVGDDSGLVSNVTVTGSVNGEGPGSVGGLIGVAGAVMNCSSTATVESFHSSVTGGLIGQGSEDGTISNSFATGAVTAKEGSYYTGGLVGIQSGGVISSSYATGAVTAGDRQGYVGGLAGEGGPIIGSFATGQVSGRIAGGLVGQPFAGSVTNSYATGMVVGGVQSTVGGLIGELKDHFHETIATSYSTGAVNAGAQSWIGGLLGFDANRGGCACFSDTDWDTTTSGVTNLSDGTGNIPNEPGIAGLTTTQLQSGLPTGFDPTIWAESPSINNGFPYLIANPPPN